MAKVCKLKKSKLRIFVMGYGLLFLLVFFLLFYYVWQLQGQAAGLRQQIAQKNKLVQVKSKLPPSSSMLQARDVQLESMLSRRDLGVGYFMQAISCLHDLTGHRSKLVQIKKVIYKQPALYLYGQSSAVALLPWVADINKQVTHVAGNSDVKVIENASVKPMHKFNNEVAHASGAWSLLTVKQVTPGVWRFVLKRRLYVSKNKV